MHDHIFWECKEATKELGPGPETKDMWQRRYGWPTGENKRKEKDEEVLPWMKKVVEKCGMCDMATQRRK